MKNCPKRFLSEVAVCLGVALVALAGCAHAPLSPKSLPLSHWSATVQDASSEPSPRTLAMAGFAAWIVDADVARASELWDRSLAAGGDDILALYGKRELALRNADRSQAAQLAFQICESSPEHALCGLVSEGLWYRTEVSPVEAEKLEKRALALLSSGKPIHPDGAASLRELIFFARQMRGDRRGAEEMGREWGLVDRAFLLGPFSRYAKLDWKTSYWPETGALEGKGLRGNVSPRLQTTDSGWLEIYGDPLEDRIYYWVADVEVPGGEYLLKVRGAATKVFVDGTLVVDLNALNEFVPAEAASRVVLSPGRHRLLAKVSRAEVNEQHRIVLVRQDGAPTDLVILDPQVAPSSGATATVTDVPQASSSAAQSVPESQTSSTASPLAVIAVPRSAPDVAEALSEEFGREIAAYIAAGILYGLDGEGARRLAEDLCGASCSAPVLAIRAKARASDSSIPRNIARGLAYSDWVQVVTKDPAHVEGLVKLMEPALRERRMAQLDELLAELAHTVPEITEARGGAELVVAIKKGIDSETATAAQRLLKVSPGNCMANEALYSLALKMGTVNEAEGYLMELSAGCPNYKRHLVRHLRERGEHKLMIDALIQFGENLSEKNNLDAFVDGYAALGDWDGAKARIEKAIRAWPYSGAAPRMLASLLDRQGDREGALAARKKVFELDGGDLSLAQAISIQTGEEILPGALEDGLKWIERYNAASPQTDAPATLVLDSTVVQAFPNGAQAVLVQMISRANDQEGASEIAKVRIPVGAQVLALRTIREDGRIVEAEPFDGGEGKISMQGVEVGDFVEMAYWMLVPADSFYAPGFMSHRFLFRSTRNRFFHSVFEMRLPKDMDDVSVIAQLIPSEAMSDTVANGQRVIRVAFDDVPPITREPQSISQWELIPWIQVVRGEDNTKFLAQWANVWWLKDRTSHEVKALANELGQGLEGRALVEALYNGVMQRISGDEKHIPASFALAQGTGGRLNLLKALLDARGFQTHFLVVQDSSLATIDSHSFLPERWNEVLLSVTLPEGELILCPSVHWAPFGVIPPAMAGSVAAVLPGRHDATNEISFIRLPTTEIAENRDQIAVALELNDQGDLKGSGESVVTGYPAATLRQILAQLGKDRVRQLVERSVVGSHFEGAHLISYDVVMDEDRPSDIAIRYAFRVPRFARVLSADRLILDKGLLPQDLASTWLSLFSRETPLEIPETVKNQTKVTLKLPPGFTLETPPADVDLNSPFGTYRRTISIEGDTVQLQSDFLLPRNRISKDDYILLGELMTSIDREEMTPWTLTKKVDAEADAKVEVTQDDPTASTQSMAPSDASVSTNT